MDRGNFSISPGNRLSTGEQRPPLMSRRCLRRPLSRDPDAVIVGAVHRCSNAPPGVIENLLVGLLANQRQGHSGRGMEITPLQRAQIVELACLEPVAKGLHIAHWSSDDLARQAVADGIVARISPRTVRDILSNVDLQPHRTRYWKTPRLHARFKERAEQVLWCYGNAARLTERGIGVVCVCVDEIPTLPFLERDPIRRAIPGSIEQQEFDYTRHDTGQ